MTKLEKELLKRVEELEARIKTLEAAPHYHYHYYNAQPAPVQPTYPTYPMLPHPWNPMTPWCSSGGAGMDSHPAIQA